MTLQTAGRTSLGVVGGARGGGGMVSQYPRFFFEKCGDNQVSAKL